MIIDEIEKVRIRDNVNWMNAIHLVFTVPVDQAKEVMIR